MNGLRLLKMIQSRSLISWPRRVMTLFAKHSTVDAGLQRERKTPWSSAEPERHLVDDEEMVQSVGEVVYELRKEFESGDEILKQRVQELEQQVSSYRAAFHIQSG